MNYNKNNLSHNNVKLLTNLNKNDIFISSITNKLEIYLNNITNNNLYSTFIGDIILTSGKWYYEIQLYM